MRAGWPVTAAGMTIGLLGGSFDPPHSGHVAITLAALRRFRLDRVWWLVSPGNPLKSKGPAPMTQRIAAAHALLSHPRVAITGLEADLGTRYTADTLAALDRRWPAVRFVWLMGSDNLAGFHRWEDWRGILHRVPVGVLARPGSRMAAQNAPAARAFARSRLPEAQAARLARLEAPAWCMVNLPLDPASSSAIRARTDWGRVAPADTDGQDAASVERQGR